MGDNDRISESQNIRDSSRFSTNLNLFGIKEGMKEFEAQSEIRKIIFDIKNIGFM
jgi:hypothetical protein